jgi:hypothetical protein
MEAPLVEGELDIETGSMRQVEAVACMAAASAVDVEATAVALGIGLAALAENGRIHYVDIADGLALLMADEHDHGHC